MKEKKPAKPGVGVPVNRFTIPLFAVVAVLHILIVLLIMDVNQSSTRLSDLMQRSGRYQIEATGLQANSSALFETSNGYIRLPVRKDGTPSVGRLSSVSSVRRGGFSPRRTRGSPCAW